MGRFRGNAALRVPRNLVGDSDPSRPRRLGGCGAPAIAAIGVMQRPLGRSPGRASTKPQPRVPSPNEDEPLDRSLGHLGGPAVRRRLGPRSRLRPRRRLVRGLRGRLDGRRADGLHLVPRVRDRRRVRTRREVGIPPALVRQTTVAPASRGPFVRHPHAIGEAPKQRQRRSSASHAQRPSADVSLPAARSPPPPASPHPPIPRSAARPPRRCWRTRASVRPA